MSVRKNQKTCTGRSLAQFEAFVLKVDESEKIKGGSTEQVDDYGGSEIIIMQ